MAVQRHRAASRSTSPRRRLQHGRVGGAPITTLFTKFSTLAHTPNFRASLGHFPVLLGLGKNGFGLGMGFGPAQVPHELTRAQKRMLRERKRASEAVFLLEIPISQNSKLLLKCDKIIQVLGENEREKEKGFCDGGNVCN